MEARNNKFPPHEIQSPGKNCCAFALPEEQNFMTTNELVGHITDRIATSSRAFISPEEVGWLVTSYPVLGGGSRCIVLGVEHMIVRLVEDRGRWVAEHLVVRGED